MCNENGRHEGERETFQGNKHWPGEKDDLHDMRAPRESGGEDNAQIPVLL